VPPRRAFCAVCIGLTVPWHAAIGTILVHVFASLTVCATVRPPVACASLTILARFCVYSHQRTEPNEDEHSHFNSSRAREVAFLFLSEPTRDQRGGWAVVIPAARTSLGWRQSEQARPEGERGEKLKTKGKCELQGPQGALFVWCAASEWRRWNRLADRALAAALGGLAHKCCDF